VSIIRLSTLKSAVHAPTEQGSFDHDAYSGRTRTGRLEEFPETDFATPLRARSPLRLHLTRAVTERAAKLPAAAPVAVLVHGFLFDPKMGLGAHPRDTDNPHGRNFHFRGDLGSAEEIREHTTSWPLGLAFAEEDEGESGLAVAFGWQSQPGFASSLLRHFENFYSRAYQYAGETSHALVRTLQVLAEVLPGRRIDLFCHSLGSRVVVRALALAAKHDPALVGRVGRVLILGGAEYVVEAQLMASRLHALPAPPTIYNIVSRENDVLDKLGENFGPRTFGNSQVIGHNGLDRESAQGPWIDLQIDRRELGTWLEKQHGVRISGDQPDSIWDHWYYYTYPGNMDLYRRILRDRDTWEIGKLRKAGIPEGVPRRWWDFGD